MAPRISQKIAVGTVFVAAMFMTILDATIVNVALPTIGRDFGVSATAVDGIAIAFLVSLAITIPASGWLGDRYGGKRVLLAAIALFTAASALCGLASSLGELIVFRILQGAAGGMLAPVGMAMLYRVFPPDERIKAAAILTVPTTFAPALGPVLGGLFVTELSWRWVFYVNLPIGAAAFAFGAIFLRQSVQDQPGRFDLAGFLLSGFGLGLLMYGVSEGPDRGWDDARVLTTIAAGAVLLSKTIKGFEIRVVGAAPRAARFGGFNSNQLILLTFAISGALAGLAGIIEVAGPVGHLQPGISPGYGFTAIIVAFLGRLNPVGILIAGLFLALTFIGGEQAQIAMKIPLDVTKVFQGILLFFVLACDSLILYRFKLIFASPKVSSGAR